MKSKNTNIFAILSIIFSFVAFVCGISINIFPGDMIFRLTNMPQDLMNTEVRNYIAVCVMFILFIVFLIGGVIVIRSANRNLCLAVSIIALVLNILIHFTNEILIKVLVNIYYARYFGANALAFLSTLNMVSSFLCTPLIVLSIVFMAIACGSLLKD